MASQRREVSLLIDENGQERVARATVTADSDDEAVRLTSNTALAVLSPSAKVVGVCVFKHVRSGGQSSSG